MSALENETYGWFEEVYAQGSCVCWGVCNNELQAKKIRYSKRIELTNKQKNNLAFPTDETRFKYINGSIMFFISPELIDKSLFNSVLLLFDDKTEILEMLFNINSVNLISNGYLGRYKSSIFRIEEFIRRVGYYGLDTHSFLIDSTAVLALYGIRPMGDIDFLTNVEYPCEMESDDVENNNKYLEYHSVKFETLINNPKHYLLYKGIKVISLEELSVWKSNKGTKKDMEDVKLMSGFLTGGLSDKMYRRKVLIRRKIKIIIDNLYRILLQPA